jgi:hypothetical protein
MQIGLQATEQAFHGLEYIWRVSSGIQNDWRTADLGSSSKLQEAFQLLLGEYALLSWQGEIFESLELKDNDFTYPQDIPAWEALMFEFMQVIVISMARLLSLSFSNQSVQVLQTRIPRVAFQGKDRRAPHAFNR